MSATRILWTALPTLPGGLVHCAVPRRTYIINEIGQEIARPRQHISGLRYYGGYEYTVSSAIACNYCIAMDRIARGDV